MEDKGCLSIVCLCWSSAAPTFCLFHGRKTSLGEGIYGSPQFLLSTFSQIREPPGRLLSPSVEPQMPYCRLILCQSVTFWAGMF